MTHTSRHTGEEFEYYVERQFINLFDYIDQIDNAIGTQFFNINQRLDKMATLAEELGVDETTLATVIPELATEITSIQTGRTEKEAALTADAATLAADSAELAANAAELAALQAVQTSLAPLVEKAKALVSAPVVTPPAETPPVVTPPVEVVPPVETPPVP